MFISSYIQSFFLKQPRFALNFQFFHNSIISYYSLIILFSYKLNLVVSYRIILLPQGHSQRLPQGHSPGHSQSHSKGSGHESGLRRALICERCSRSAEGTWRRVTDNHLWRRQEQEPLAPSRATAFDPVMNAPEHFNGSAIPADPPNMKN